MRHILFTVLTLLFAALLVSAVTTPVQAGPLPELQPPGAAGPAGAAGYYAPLMGAMKGNAKCERKV